MNQYMDLLSTFYCTIQEFVYASIVITDIVKIIKTDKDIQNNTKFSLKCYIVLGKIPTKLKSAKNHNHSYNESSCRNSGNFVLVSI